MSNIHESGPAYPIVTGSEVYGLGMSLRDWFAGQALAGMMAMPSDPHSGNFHNNCGEPFIGAAEYAYRQADAMIAARGQP